MNSDVREIKGWQGAWFKNMPGVNPDNLIAAVQQTLCTHGFFCTPAQARKLSNKLRGQWTASLGSGKKAWIYFDQESEKCYGRETPPQRESLGLVRKGRRGKQSQGE